jgi:hypothetical protein
MTNPICHSLQKLAIDRIAFKVKNTADSAHLSRETILRR